MSSVESETRGRLRAHSFNERIADGLVHAIGLAMGLCGAAILVGLTYAHSPEKLGAVAIYALCLIAMLGASAAYNLAHATRFRHLLRRCDHSAIFLMIAGTYTPFIFTLFTPYYAAGLTGLIWTLSLGGILLKNFEPVLFDKVNVVLYLALGWIAVIIIGPLLASLSGFTIAALIVGGALYTGGITFHVWESLPFQNAIWHVFVLAAALCHYFAVLDGVVLRGTLG